MDPNCLRRCTALSILGFRSASFLFQNVYSTTYAMFALLEKLPSLRNRTPMSPIQFVSLRLLYCFTILLLRQPILQFKPCLAGVFSNNKRPERFNLRPCLRLNKTTPVLDTILTRSHALPEVGILPCLMCRSIVLGPVNARTLSDTDNVRVLQLMCCS